MKEFEIWAEGFRTSGEQGFATILGKENAESWDEAVEKYMEKNPGRIRKDSRGYTDWGCRLFDNEADARKSFG
jgi:hypothetical protein